MDTHGAQPPEHPGRSGGDSMSLEAQDLSLRLNRVPLLMDHLARQIGLAEHMVVALANLVSSRPVELGDIEATVDQYSDAVYRISRGTE